MKDVNTIFHRFKSGAGNGNRTRIASLEGWSFTIKLYPLVKLSGGIVKLSLERVKLRLWCGRGVAGVCASRVIPCLTGNHFARADDR